MSTEFQLVTRTRPGPWAFVRTLTETAGHALDIDGDFGDPDDFLNISDDDGLWIEVEPPGHVEYDDLRSMIDEETALPEPDDEGCLWHATARIPASGSPLGINAIWETFLRLAEAHDGVAIEDILGKSEWSTRSLRAPRNHSRKARPVISGILAYRVVRPIPSFLAISDFVYTGSSSRAWAIRSSVITVGLPLRCSATDRMDRAVACSEIFAFSEQS